MDRCEPPAQCAFLWDVADAVCRGGRVSVQRLQAALEERVSSRRRHLRGSCQMGDENKKKGGRYLFWF